MTDPTRPHPSHHRNTVLPAFALLLAGVWVFSRFGARDPATRELAFERMWLLAGLAGVLILCGFAWIVWRTSYARCPQCRARIERSPGAGKLHFRCADCGVTWTAHHHSRR